VKDRLLFFAFLLRSPLRRLREFFVFRPGATVPDAARNARD
jgi:hypothetical protein